MLNFNKPCVYLLFCNGVYKIGFTKRDINKRIKEFKTGNHNDIMLVETFYTDYYSKIESDLHFSYRDKKISGEWYNLDENDLERFIPLCEKFENIQIVLQDNIFHKKNNKYEFSNKCDRTVYTIN